MNSRKNLFVTTILAVSMLGGALAITKLNENRVFSFKTTKADDYSIVLNSGTAVAGLTSTASNGSFDTETEAGNTISWEYNSAKTNALGFITLCRVFIGNATGDEGYIVNTDPITSVQSIDVTYSGTDGYLTFYGSIDGINFERVITISESGSVTELNKYFYFKIASGERSKADLNITSLTINYACNEADFIKDSRDAINATTFFSEAKNTSDEDVHAAEFQTTELFDSNRSSTGVVWTNNLSNKYKYMWMYLPRTYSVEELAHSTISTHVKVDNATASGSESGFTFVLDFFYNGWDSENKSTSSLYPWYNLKLSTWQTVNKDLSESSFSQPVNRIRICVNDIITSGSVYIDDIYIFENNTFPSYVYDYSQSLDEKGDLINDGINNGSAAIVGEFSYDHISSKGDRSFKIKMTNSYNWAHLDALYNVDLTGKIIEFDYIYTGGGTTQFAFLCVDNSGVEPVNKYYYRDVSSSTTGLTSNTFVGLDGNTWHHVEIDVDAYVSAHSSGAKSDANYQGLRHTDAAETTYIDNLYVSDK